MNILNTILEHSTHAPSIFNTQPWSIKFLSRDEFLVIISDSVKGLYNMFFREIIISIGAFLEALFLSSRALGRDATIEYTRRISDDGIIAKVKLSEMKPDNASILSLIKERRTIRAGYLSDEFSDNYIEILKIGFKDVIYYSRNCDTHENIRNLVINSFVKLINYDPLIDRLSTYFKIGDVIPAQGISFSRTSKSGFLTKFINSRIPDSLYSSSTRRFLIDDVINKTNIGNGWIILSTKNDTHLDKLIVGRAYYRLSLSLMIDNIGLYPMSYPIASHVEREALKGIINDRYPQMLIKTGFYQKSDDDFFKTCGRKHIKIKK